MPSSIAESIDEGDAYLVSCEMDGLCGTIENKFSCDRAALTAELLQLLPRRGSPDFVQLRDALADEMEASAGRAISNQNTLFHSECEIKSVSTPILARKFGETQYFYVLNCSELF